MQIIADVGATRGRWVILGEGQKKMIETKGFNPYVSKETELLNSLQELSKILNCDEISAITYYGAGVNNNDSKNIIKRCLKKFFKNSKINVHSDLLGSCRALCYQESGVVAILGTGSNSCYYDGKNITMQINSLGYLLGDEGSGYALGRNFLKKYLRNEVSEKISDLFQEISNFNKDNLQLVYEKNSHKWISKISEFIHTNKEDESIKSIIINHFTYFFKEILLKYNSKNLYLSGSIAYYFEDEIKDVSRLFDLSIIKILRDPINHLVDYHVSINK